MEDIAAKLLVKWCVTCYLFYACPHITMLAFAYITKIYATSPKKLLFKIWIRMFLDLPDPHPDPYQNITDPKTLFFCFVLFFCPENATYTAERVEGIIWWH